MGLFDMDGNPITTSFFVNGQELFSAYDKAGNTISKTLKVMSFNVGCFYSQYFPCPDNVTNEFYNRHRTIFNKHKPDLCGMPEWYDSIGSISSDVLMDEFWKTYIANYEAYQGSSKPHNAITFASKYPLSDASITAYTNQAGETRYYQKAYLQIGNKKICFANTHLGTSDIRNSQFVELLNMLENEEYFIAVGDFNFRIETAGDSEYDLSVQLAVNKGFNSAQSIDGIYMTGYHGETVESSTSITALDNIITSGNIKILSVEVDSTKITDGLCQENNIIIDHLPLIATLTID